MKVLWFEVTPPGKYLGQGMVIGGWQDSLERIVRTCSEIDLTISFEVYSTLADKCIEGVNYMPMYIKYNNQEKQLSQKTWEINAEKLIPEMKRIVNTVKPDIIHVFGTEWPYGLIAEYTDIPVVIHIQGAIAPYNNAMFPPNYNFFDVIREIGWKHPKRIKKAWWEYSFDKSRLLIENRVWKVVKYYMGRTEWDKNLSEMMHPGRTYFHVEEALRQEFSICNTSWKNTPREKITLISTGCSTFWKGPDMLIKVAKILKEYGVNFEWKVAGSMRENVKRIVEMKEDMSFEENNIIFLGFIEPNELSKHLTNATMYVHTAYVENSPNSICEAQCLGVPIVSTNVGGIASLVKDGEQGILVPANDPWQMAHAIIKLAKDNNLMMRFSNNSKEIARQRHSDEHIKEQLLRTYQTIIEENKC